MPPSVASAGDRRGPVGPAREKTRGDLRARARSWVKGRKRTFRFELNRPSAQGPSFSSSTTFLGGILSCRLSETTTGPNKSKAGGGSSPSSQAADDDLFGLSTGRLATALDVTTRKKKPTTPLNKQSEVYDAKVSYE